MICASCRRENPEGAAFCGGCGAALGPARPAGPIPPEPYPPPPPRTSGLAVASLVCGVLGLLCLPPLIAPLLGLVLGIMALSAISRSGGHLQGQGIAIAGVAVSGVGVLSIPIVAALLFPVFAQAREKARLTSCISNQKQLAIGTLMYTQDYDEVMPGKSNWADALAPYTRDPSLLHCPSDRPDHARSYAYNARLNRVEMANTARPAFTTMLFDANGSGENPAGGPELLARRHTGGYVVAFVDGHARSFYGGSPASDELTWDPATR